MALSVHQPRDFIVLTLIGAIISWNRKGSQGISQPA